MSEYTKGDQSFDAIADKFHRNIYGTTKGRLRHELLLYYLDAHVLSRQSRIMDVLDVGAGTGVMAAEMASRGHRVVVNDISEECLTLAKQHFAQLRTARFLHQPLQQLSECPQQDLVICHAVLEWLERPLDALALLIDRLKPGGYLSLSFFNKDAQRFGNVLYGNFDYVQADLKVKKKVRLNPDQALEPAVVLNHLAHLPVTLMHQAGIRVFHDYLKQKEDQELKYEQLKSLELAYGKQHPYLWLGKYFQVIVRRD